MGYQAIIVIVERGNANEIVKKASKAGAKGATIVFGRGSGEQVFSFFRSLQVEPSKEIILIIVPDEQLDSLFPVIVDAAKVDEPGKGIAFTVPISNLAGVAFNQSKPDEASS